MLNSAKICVKRMQCEHRSKCNAAIYTCHSFSHLTLIATVVINLVEVCRAIFCPLTWNFTPLISDPVLLHIYICLFKIF